VPNMVISRFNDRARATAFGTVAEHYDRYRPPPPAAAVEWLLPAGARLVADLCAGTGGFSRVLASRGPDVIAVELDLRMAMVLHRHASPVRVVNGNGQRLPLRTSSLDAVLVSAGWHWLDPDVAVPEIARVLRPGGVLGLVWSSPNRRVGWAAELLARRRTQAGMDNSSRGRLRLPPGPLFSDPEQHVIEWSLKRTRDQLVGLLGTYSGVINLSPDDRRALLGQAESRIDRHVSQSGQDIELPMITRCARAIRRG
jgi:SAM-dependent methyltransferase